MTSASSSSETVVRSRSPYPASAKRQPGTFSMAADIWVTVGSLALTLVLVTFQSLVVQKTQS